MAHQRTGKKVRATHCPFSTAPYVICTVYGEGLRIAGGVGRFVGIVPDDVYVCGRGDFHVQFDFLPVRCGHWNLYYFDVAEYGRKMVARV